MPEENKTITFGADLLPNGDLAYALGAEGQRWNIYGLLQDSGVTSSTYGPTATATLAHGGKFIVPYFYVTADGRIQEAGSTTYTLPSSGNYFPSAWCGTGTATLSKTASCTNFSLANKSWIHVLLRYGNTNTSMTLNINGTGAKAVKVNGNAPAASGDNYLSPGTYLVYYDGTNYNFRTDGKLPGHIIGDAGSVDGRTITDVAPNNSSTSGTIPSSTAVWAAISSASGYGKTGTVTSVLIQASSPLTSSLSAAQSDSLSTTISFIPTTANYILAGPTSGSNTAPPMLRQLVEDDIPNLSANKITSDTLALDRIPTITNDKLLNKKITINGGEVELGGSLSLADIGLSGAMHFKGTTATLPDATATNTFNSYEAGDVLLGPNNKEYIYNRGSNAASSSWVELGDEASYKIKQTAISDPSAGSTAATSFISAISLNENGVITATKSPLPIGTASVTGIVKLGTAEAEAAKGNHSHGNIGNGGTVGSTANYGVVTNDSKQITVMNMTVNSPNASGTTTVFVSSVTLSSQGKIGVSRANLPTASSTTAGIAKLGATGGAATFEHTHGNIANNGTVGSGNNVLITSSGEITAGPTITTGASYSTNNTSLTFGTLPVEYGGTGITEVTAVNAVVIGNSSSTTGALLTIATNSGAFYSTAENELPLFGTLPMAYGGTGVESVINNRILHTITSDNVLSLTSSGHYISDTAVAINSTAAPTEALYVNGATTITGITQITNTATGAYSSGTLSGALLVSGGLGIEGITNIKDLFNIRSTSGLHLYNGANEYGALTISTTGTSSTTGVGLLTLGNSSAAGSANNARGCIRLYSYSTGYTNIYSSATNGQSYSIYIPPYAGTMYAAHVGSTGTTGSTKLPVYVNSNGRLTNTTYYLYATVGNSSTTGAPVNLLAWSTAANKIGVGSHYVSTTALAVNTTTAQTENFYVDGTAKVTTSLSTPEVKNATDTLYLLKDSGALLIGKAGMTTADTRSLYGKFTFYTTGGFQYSGIGTATGDSYRVVWFNDDTLDGKPVINSNFTYNPNSGILSVGNGYKFGSNAIFEWNSTLQCLEISFPEV